MVPKLGASYRRHPPATSDTPPAMAPASAAAEAASATLHDLVCTSGGPGPFHKVHDFGRQLFAAFERFVEARTPWLVSLRTVLVGRDGTLEVPLGDHATIAPVRCALCACACPSACASASASASACTNITQAEKIRTHTLAVCGVSVSVAVAVLLYIAE